MNDTILDGLPGGYLALNDNGSILAINKTLLDLSGYQKEEVMQKHIDVLLTGSSRLFYQLYFFPIIKNEEKVEEMYISLSAKNGKEIPVLLNANRIMRDGSFINECLFIPMYKRHQLEDELVKAKKDAETAVEEKNKVNEALEEKQRELYLLLDKNKKYQEKIQKELELAKKVQNVSLSQPIKNEQLRIATFYQSSSELSGDMFGCYRLDEFQYGVIIIDVMGHGVSAALISNALRSLYQTLISKRNSMETVIRELDRYLLSLFENNTDIRHYATVLYLRIDTQKKEIDYINAGHPPGFLIDDQDTMLLSSSSPPVGLVSGLEFKASKLNYNGSSRIFLYTDGITDLITSKELSYLLKVKKEETQENLKNKLIQRLKDRKGSLEEEDDQSFIMIDL